jgi:hypothetical protein
LSSEQLLKLPLEIKMTTYENSSVNFPYHWIIVISNIIIISVLIIILICRKIRSRSPILMANMQRPLFIQSNQILLELNNVNNNNNNANLYEEYYKNELKTVVYKKGINSFGDDCGICIEPAIEDISLVIYLPCKHFFHEICIKDWINANVASPKCPYCNDNILEHIEKIKKENISNDNNLIV